MILLISILSSGRFVTVRGILGYVYQPRLAQHFMEKDHQVFVLAGDLSKHNTIQEIYQGHLLRQRHKLIYLYGQVMSSSLLFGFFLETSLADYQSSKIKRHQLTLSNRTHRQSVKNDHLGPITLTFRQHSQLFSRIIDKYSPLNPDLQWHTLDGRQHMLWRLSLSQFSKGIKNLYILDGHHRSEAYLVQYLQNKAKAQMQGMPFTGQQIWSYMLATVYPPQYIKIHAQYRVLQFQQDFNANQIAIQLNKFGNLSTQSEQIQRNQVKICFQKSCRLLSYLDEKPVGSIEELDVYFVDKVLIPFLTQLIGTPKIKFRPAVLGEFKLQPNQLSILYFPITIQELFDTADLNRTLTPKATWIQPKPALRAVVRLPRPLKRDKDSDLR